MTSALSSAELRIELISAVGLYNVAKLSKQDPYVEVVIDDKVVRKSKADKRAGTDPVWEEELDINLPSGTNAPDIKFVIKDKNLLTKDTVIGIATMDLARGLSGEESLPVYSPTGEPAGQLKIRMISGHDRYGRHGAGKTAAGVGAAAGAGAAAAGARHGTATTTGTGVADRGAGMGMGTGRPHGVAAAGAGTGVAGAAERAAGRHEERRELREENRGLHGGQAAGIGAGVGAAAAAGHRPGAHGTATTGLERDLENKARIGTGTSTGTRHTGAMGAAERGVERAEMGAERTAGAATGHGRGAPGFTGDMTNLREGGAVCDQKFYTVEEDRPIVKEVKQYVREHHPVEREMVTETKTTGRERAGATGPSELVNVEERVVDRTIPKACP